MSASIVVAKIATLRFSPESVTSSAFSVRITGPSSDISSSFNGAGEVEMNEVTFECGKDDTLTVAVLEADLETHRVEIPMEKIRENPDWAILQVKDFEVRVQFLISEPVPSDFIDATFDLIGGPKAWYFKADELYALIKTVAQQLKLPTQLGVTSEQLIERVSKLVDMATDAVMKKISPLSAQEEISVLQKLDELLTSQCTAFDSMVDSSRLRLIESLRNLKLSLEVSLAKHKRFVESTVESTKDLSTKALDNVTNSVDKLTTSAKASAEDAKGQVSTYTSYVKDQVDSVKSQVQNQVDNVKGQVTARVNTLSEESKAWATAFLNARVVQGKGALDTAQPYVIQAVGATQPYASRVVTAAQPYLNMAIPYVDEIKKYAENNEYVGPYVAPVLNTANHVLDEAKQYMGLSAAPAVEVAASESTVDISSTPAN